MTLVIAVVLEDGVVIVADGRQHHPFDPTAIPRDNVQKIQRVAEGIVAAELGVSQASELALPCIRQVGGRAPTPERFAENLSQCVEGAWETFLTQRLVGPVDMTNPNMRVALVCGGMVAGRPFITGVLRGIGATSPPALSTEVFGYIVSGGVGATEVNAKREFSARLKFTYDRLMALKQKPMGERVAREVISIAGETIANASRTDTTVGGQVRYAWIRGGGIEEGLFPSTQG